jgi:tRNA(adenine34) deaminase
MTHEHWMGYALREAEKAASRGEVPVGAVVIANNQIIGRGHNLVETLQDATAHAEMISITAAAGSLGSWRLDDATLYVTLEPCPMCSGAILLSRVGTVVFGAADPRFGACGSVANVIGKNPFGAPVELVPGIMENQSQLMLQEFFQKVRQRKIEK